MTILGTEWFPAPCEGNLPAAPRIFTKGIEMAIWSELKEFLYQTYKIESDSGDTLRMLFNVGAGRSQFISVHNFDPMVTFSTPFGKVGEINPELVLQSAVPFGVAQTGEFYMLIHTAWLATLDELEVRAPIEVLVTKADEIEKRLTGKDRF